MPLQLADLRRYAIARSLFAPPTLARAVARLGFVQADPIRAPARAQDLTLRHRVRGYRAGDLDARYRKLGIEEDFLVNYGFMPRHVHALMHPRIASRVWDATTRDRAAEVLAFVRERGSVHPREVDERFAHGKVRNYWGGSSNATTHLLEGMHYRGMLRVLRRDKGIRIYAPREYNEAGLEGMSPAERLDRLVDLVVNTYAPLPARTFAPLLRRLRYGAPQWADEVPPAIERARARLAHAKVDGAEWFWPADEHPRSRTHAITDAVRVLTPFDPVVWDRERFERFWGWTYRFEAYTPEHKRKLGYYALPLLWRERVIGWANASVREGRLSMSTHYTSGRAPRDVIFKREFDAERGRLAEFLAL